MTDTDSKPAAIPPARPLTPRPKLLIAVSVVFAAWVGFMIWMYTATVWPMRHDAATTTPAAPPAESR